MGVANYSHRRGGGGECLKETLRNGRGDVGLKGFKGQATPHKPSHWQDRPSSQIYMIKYVHVSVRSSHAIPPRRRGSSMEGQIWSER